MNKTVKPSWKKWALPACAACALLAAAAFLLRTPGDSLELADNATMGVLPGVDLAQRQAELQRELDESLISFSINTSPVFETGGSEGSSTLYVVGTLGPAVPEDSSFTVTPTFVVRKA